MDLSQFMHLPYFLFDKDQDSGGGGEEDVTEDEDPEDAEDDEVTFTPAQQKLINKMLNKTKDSALEKARKEAEDKAKKEKEDAEKLKLQEQGEFKKLAEEAEKKAAQEQARADTAVAETKRLKLQRQFEVAVAEAGLEFVSPKAAEDAFGHLDTDAVGDDYSGMADAVKSLIDEYDYLFGERVVKAPDIDAVNKSNANNKKISREDLRKQKKSTGRYSAI